MSAIQQITPRVGELNAQVRQAKTAGGHTNQSLADASGVSLSTLSKFLSGATSDPKLSDAAALAMTLGLSLDALCGLSAPPESDADLTRRVHELELDNARLAGEVERLRAVGLIQGDSLSAQRPLIYGMGVLCIVLAFALSAYLIADAQHPSIGLIQWGDLSLAAWALVILIACSTTTTVLLIYRVYRHGRRNHGGAA